MSGCKGLITPAATLLWISQSFFSSYSHTATVSQKLRMVIFFSTDIHHHRDHYKCKISKGLAVERVEGCMFALPFYKII